MTIRAKRAVSRNNSKPWYQKGLNFRCVGCGDCCTGAPGYVWVNDEEIDSLATAIGLDRAEFVETHTRRVDDRTSLVELANGDCIFFDSGTRQCTVYLQRPRQCRTWPFWESNVATAAEWAATGCACRGIGKGARYAVAEIESRLRVIEI